MLSITVTTNIQADVNFFDQLIKDHGLKLKLGRYDIIIITFITIITTRPKPAYGRQGLAGSWGQDTDQAGTFWGVLNVSLRACSAQLGFKPT